MQPRRMDEAGDSRLRVVFDDAVVSLSLAANATLEDVADALADLSSRRYGNAVAVDVTLAVPALTFGATHAGRSF